MNNKHSKPSDKKPIVRSAVCVSVAFIEAMLVSLLVIALALMLAVSPTFALGVIDKSDYSKYATKELTEDLNDLAIPAGLPESFFDDKVSYEKFNEIFIDKFTANLSGNNEYKLDLDNIQTDIKGYVDEYAKEYLSSEEAVSEDAISEFLNECTTTYLQYLNPSVFSFILPYFAKIASILIPVIIGLAVLIILVFIFLFKLCFNKDLRKYTFAVLSGAGLVCGVLPAFLLITDEISKIGITSKSLYSFICQFANDLLWLLVIFAAALIFIALILFILEIRYLIFKKKSSIIT